MLIIVESCDRNVFCNSVILNTIRSQNYHGLVIYMYFFVFILEFFEKELKSNDVEPVELRAIPDVPPQKRMIDLEVSLLHSVVYFMHSNFSI